MERRTVLKYLAGAAATFCPTCLSTISAFAAEKGGQGGAHGSPPHWGYEGAEGPMNWGQLSPEYKACSLGVQQSPIDLTAAIPADAGPIDVSYRRVPLKVINNGHTIQVNCDPGSGIMVDGKRFGLLQFHFHHPSEHALDGTRFDMEAHFVHASEDGVLAVLGVFIRQGESHPLLAPIWRAMPEKAGPERTVSSEMISPADLLPADRRYFRYLGSLTTPPCSETVIWSVYRTPVNASGEQIRQFAGLFPMNARPLQPLHRRLLLENA